MPFYNQSKLLLPPVVINSKLEYKIFWIVNSKIDHRHIYKLFYKVIWLKYKNTEEKSNWLSTSKLTHIPNFIFNFYQAYSNRLGPLPLPQLWHPSIVISFSFLFSFFFSLSCLISSWTWILQFFFLSFFLLLKIMALTTSCTTRASRA